MRCRASASSSCSLEEESGVGERGAREPRSVESVGSGGTGTRRRITEGPALRLDDLDANSVIDPALGWWPGRGQRWNTYSDFLADHTHVRDELLKMFPAQRDLMFAERLSRFQQRHGATALLRASHDAFRTDAGSTPYDVAR
jgi:hypothetical protein